MANKGILNFFLMSLLTAFVFTAISPIQVAKANPNPTKKINLQWNQTWGGTDNDVAKGVAVEDNAMYLAGYTYSFRAEGADAFLLKYDLDGNLVWNKTWGRTGASVYGVAIRNNAIYTVGCSLVGGFIDALLLKYDLDGNLVWNKMWRRTCDDYAHGVAVKDNAIYMAGVTGAFRAGRGDAFLLKYVEPMVSVSDYLIVIGGVAIIILVLTPIAVIRKRKKSLRNDDHRISYFLSRGSSHVAWRRASTFSKKI